MLKREHSYSILTILQDIAPNSEAQNKCRDLYTMIEMDEGLGNQSKILRRMTAALYDGLAYGNWPWNLPIVTVPRVERDRKKFVK